MFVRRLAPTAVAAICMAASITGQNTNPVISSAAKAMGTDALTSITYSGTARNGAFGQSKSIGEPMGAVNLTQVTGYTRTITFAPASDAAAIQVTATAVGPSLVRRMSASGVDRLH